MFLQRGHVLLELVLNHLYWREEEEGVAPIISNAENFWLHSQAITHPFLGRDKAFPVSKQSSL